MHQHRVDFHRGNALSRRHQKLRKRAPPGTYFHHMKVPGRDGRLGNPPENRSANQKMLAKPPRHPETASAFHINAAAAEPQPYFARGRLPETRSRVELR